MSDDQSAMCFDRKANSVRGRMGVLLFIDGIRKLTSAIK